MITLKLNRQEQAMILERIGSWCPENQKTAKAASALYDKIQSATLAQKPRKQTCAFLQTMDSDGTNKYP